ncbi:protein kinase domain-containing protein [Marininema halotolerans]|uniref:protein kinase domain-containing protein n=1 Tax=Marininema halotolerans TaxID=1155944 RepID=UPI001595E702|nr:protein kinase [Marininema halotolerans]
MEGKYLGGRYEILRRLGGGGMAVVYLARDQLLERQVAIKVMNESLSHDDDFIRRFAREAKAAAIMSHPHVINVYDVGREDHIHYMVMEYMNGASLMDVIEQRGSLPPEEAISIISQVCSGLSHAHEQGIIHRDIKPHNIMQRNGQYKLGDFGISRLNGATSITQTGFVMGSVHYFSPEQARGRDIGYQSDIYSLGVVLFYLVTGELPFQGEEAVAIALKHLQEPVPDPRMWNPHIPIGVCEVISRAMEKEPQHRYVSADEMKNDLDRVLENPLSSTRLMENDPAPVARQVIEDNHEDIHTPLSGERLPSRSHSGRVPELKKTRKKTGWIVAGAGLAIILLLFSFLVMSNLGSHPVNGASPKPVHHKKKVDHSEDNKDSVTHDPADDNDEGNQGDGTEDPTTNPTNPSDQSNEPTDDSYDWNQDIPGAQGDNNTFSGFSQTGANGNYQVNVAVKAAPGQGVFYDVILADHVGQRETTSHQPIQHTSDGTNYSPTKFSVSTPIPPGEGIVKIRMYRVDSGTNQSVDPVEYLLYKADQ